MRLSINVWQSFVVCQSFVAPVLAGVANYALVRVIGGLIWHRDIVTSLVLLFVGCVLSLVSYMFFYGLFGGWDENGLKEFRRASEIASFGRPVGALMAFMSRLGGCLSPLHNRFPVVIYERGHGRGGPADGRAGEADRLGRRTFRRSGGRTRSEVGAWP